MTEEELEASYAGLSRALLAQAGISDTRCQYSDLLKNHCAHCLHHTLDFDPKEVHG